MKTLHLKASEEYWKSSWFHLDTHRLKELRGYRRRRRIQKIIIESVPRNCLEGPDRALGDLATVVVVSNYLMIFLRVELSIATINKLMSLSIL